MFGSKRKSHHHHPTTTTTHTTHTRPSHSAGFMTRLRPRRNTPPTLTNYSATAPATTHTTTRRSRGTRTGFGRRKRAHGTHHHHTTTTHTTTAPAAVPARRVSLGDKMSGAMLKLRGSLTGRPGLKGAGTRRMHGTDGRGTRRYY